MTLRERLVSWFVKVFKLHYYITCPVCGRENPVENVEFECPDCGVRNIPV